MGKLVTGRFSGDGLKEGNSGSSGGDDGGMSELLRRVTNLETDVKAIQGDVSKIQRDVAVEDKTLDHMVSIMATKSDIVEIKAAMANLETSLHKEISSLIWKIMTWFVAAIGLVFAIARYIKP